jgi:hypothetical protein
LATSKAIQRAAREAAAEQPHLNAKRIVRFLETGLETWTQGITQKDFDYGAAAKAALRRLYALLAAQLPPDVDPSITPEDVRHRIAPMIRGLVPAHQQEVALKQLG